MLAEDEDLAKAEKLLGWPMVVKIPDGSFSRGVHKVETAEALKKLSDELFEDTDLLLAQKFMPTKFDWRVGVLDGEPLYVCQYQMARGHWQIIKHGPNGAREGGSKTLAIAEVPPRVIEVALKAARAIGPGLYGVDIKESNGEIVVIEVNDNPNLEHGVEDLVGKDEVWTRLLNWFIKRIDAWRRARHSRRARGSLGGAGRPQSRSSGRQSSSRDARRAEAQAAPRPNRQSHISSENASSFVSWRIMSGACANAKTSVIGRTPKVLNATHWSQFSVWRRTSFTPASAKKNNPQRTVNWRQPAASRWKAVSRTIGSSSLPNAIEPRSAIPNRQ